MKKLGIVKVTCLMSVLTWGSSFFRKVALCLCAAFTATGAFATRYVTDADGHDSGGGAGMSIRSFYDAGTFDEKVIVYGTLAGEVQGYGSIPASSDLADGYEFTAATTSIKYQITEGTTANKKRFDFYLFDGQYIFAQGEYIAKSSITDRSEHIVTGLTVGRRYRMWFVRNDGFFDVFLNYRVEFTPVVPSVLSSVSIAGSSSVPYGGSATYTCTATMSDGTSKSVYPTWSVTAGDAYAAIDASGKLTAKNTSASSQNVTITASYTDNGVTKTATKTVTIQAVAPAKLPNISPFTPNGWSSSLVVASSPSSTWENETTFSSADNLYLNWVCGCSDVSTSLTFYTALYVDGSFVHGWDTKGLTEGNYAWVEGHPLGKLSAGTHTIKIVHDSNGAVSESNENDNTLTKTITIENMTYGGAISDVSFSRPQAVTGVLMGNGTDILYGSVELKFGKAGTKGVKVSGLITAMEDGKTKKISAKAVNMSIAGGVMSGTLVFKSPIGSLAFSLTPNGLFTLENSRYEMVAANVGGTLASGGHTFTLGKISLASGGVLQEQLLPKYEPFSIVGGRWTFGKNATVKWAKDRSTNEYALLVDTANGKTNLSSLKLTYTPKTGLFKGSFKVYALTVSNGRTKLVKYAANVIGFVVNGVGYGEATIKNTSAKCSVTIE